MISALVDKSLKVKVLNSGTNTINLGLNTKVEVFSPEENIVSDNFMITLLSLKFHFSILHFYLQAMLKTLLKTILFQIMST